MSLHWDHLSGYWFSSRPNGERKYSLVNLLTDHNNVFFVGGVGTYLLVHGIKGEVGMIANTANKFGQFAGRDEKLKICL